VAVSNHAGCVRDNGIGANLSRSGPRRERREAGSGTMRHLLAITITIALGLSTRAAAAPDRPLTDPRSVTAATAPAAPPPPIPALFDAHGALGAAWSADGQRVIVSTNVSGRFNLWSYPLAGGAAVRLTKSDDRQLSQAVSPDGKTIVFQSDFGGNERYDLFAVASDGGAPTDLTNTPDISETGPAFSPDGRMLAFNRKLNSAPMDNVAVMDLATHTVRELTHEADPSYSWTVVAWTHDGTALIADRANRLGTKGSVWRVALGDGAATELTPGAGEALVSASDISPDGRLLAITSNAQSEDTQAAIYDIAAHRFAWLAPTPWEQGTATFSPDGRTLLFETNADGRTTLSLYDVKSGAVRDVALPPGVNGVAGAGRSEFSPDSRFVLVSHAASNTPFDYWIYDVANGHGHKVTGFAPPSLDAATLPASQLVHYKSADGTVISAFLWLPNNASRDAALPGVVLPHGGPTGQTTDVFNRTAVALASRGYAVIAPNPRGSTGYGKAFQQMNVKDLGGGDLADEIAGVTFMVATGYVDPKRVGITGGSYGGYMTLMAIGKAPDLWAAAVEEYGIIDWRTMLQHEDPSLQAYERMLLGDPATDAKVYADDSPITFIRQEKAPLLVLQGDNDIRVPKEEAEQVVAILQGEGRTVDAHYYPNEGHGFVKQENVIDALERTVAWFDKYLKGT
jgi:dipeptidyl aminopeptidase/acylaminoacyl peptidase